jgi:hypothetical protein
MVSFSLSFFFWLDEMTVVVVTTYGYSPPILSKLLLIAFMVIFVLLIA